MFISTKKYPVATEESDVNLVIFGRSGDRIVSFSEIDDKLSFFLSTAEETLTSWTGYKAGRPINATDNIRNVFPGQLVAVSLTVPVLSLGQADSIDVPTRVASVLTANQEVTPSNNPNARGTSILRLNLAGDALSYQLTVFGLDFGRFIGDGTPFTADTSDDVNLGSHPQCD